MSKKKRKWIAAVIVLMFFIVSGLWYYVVLSSAPEQEIDENWENAANQENGYTTAGENGTVTAENQSEKSNASATVPPALCYVFLCGQVAEEGVYEIPEGSRLYEALELAGGCTEEADTSYHNLARMISDGERIYFPSKEETKERSIEEKLESPETVTGDEIKQTVETGKNGQTKVNLNKASLEELMTLPGIGQAKAESIMEYRTKVGKFASIEEVMNISGIGQSMFEKMKDYIIVK